MLSLLEYHTPPNLCKPLTRAREESQKAGHLVAGFIPRWRNSQQMSNFRTIGPIGRCTGTSLYTSSPAVAGGVQATVGRPAC